MLKLANICECLNSFWTTRNKTYIFAHSKKKLAYIFYVTALVTVREAITITSKMVNVQILATQKAAH